MESIVDEIAEQRRSKPEDDLISALVNADVDGVCLTAAETGSFFILLIAAGSKTTRTAIAHWLVLLTEHPGEKERWRADREGVSPLAVEEIMRFASPVTFMRRTSTRGASTKQLDRRRSCIKSTCLQRGAGVTSQRCWSRSVTIETMTWVLEGGCTA